MGKWKGPEDKRMTIPAPEGNTRFGDYHQWRNAISRALSKKGTVDRAESLYQVADELLQCALNPESPHYEFAVKEIGLRLDGKPKEHIEFSTDDGVAAVGIGISAAFASLVKATSGGEIVDGEVVVPDRPVLSTEVCTESKGCGETVGISEMSGDSTKP